MKRVTYVLAALTLAVGFPALVGGQGEPTCEFDCFEVYVESGITGGQPYCWQFTDPNPTARLLWNPGLGGGLGGSPFAVNCNDGSPRQDVIKWDDCAAVCPLTEIPQATGTGGQIAGGMTFNCYDCSDD
jgi:hypothetical protein